MIRFKLFQTDIHKILHYRRRLPPLLPDQKDLRHQIRFIKHLTSQPFAKRLHGLREDRRGKPFLHPEGSAPGIITQAEHLRNQILRVKCIHNQLFITPVENCLWTKSSRMSDFRLSEGISGLETAIIGSECRTADSTSSSRSGVRTTEISMIPS